MRWKLLLLVLTSAFVSSELKAADQALQWRLESQFSGHYYQWGASLLPEDQQPASRQESGYLRTSLKQSGWFADLWLAQNTDPEEEDKSWHPEIDELYYDFTLEGSMSALEITLGAKSLHWDYGFLALPLNWLGPENDRSNTRHQADPMLLAESYQGMTVYQGACAWVEADETSEQREELCLLRSQGFIGKGEWQLLAGYQQDWLAGLGLAWTLTPAVAGYASASWKEQEEESLEALVGISWANAQGLEVRSEYFWGSTDAALLRLSWSPDDWTWIAGINYQDLEDPLLISELGLHYQLSSEVLMELNYFSYHPDGRPGATELDQEINLRLTYTTSGQFN